ncbi:hypothetical protein [Nocardioides rubriscoriae]|uniref:hypothetical protein n=1 Tax=Nocardioides rubriscoriae TaxID=642762 RepID=UPI0011DF5290|nr:hypothetical protein [Nocardioides rubriscoriae]
MLMRPLRSRRLTLLAAGALLASPLLGGCGFNYQTNRVNTISAGINDRDGSVDVLGAVVIAGQDDLGLFVATLSNDDLDNPVTLDSLVPTSDTQPIDATADVEVPAGGAVSLFQTGGIGISGTFGAGDFVDVSLKFSNGQVSTLTVNVVPPCRAYSLDKLTELTLPTSATPSGTTATESPSASEAAGDTTGASEEAASAADGEPGPYSCDYATAEPHGEEPASEAPAAGE